MIIPNLSAKFNSTKIDFQTQKHQGWLELSYSIQIMMVHIRTPVIAIDTQNLIQPQLISLKVTGRFCAWGYTTWYFCTGFRPCFHTCCCPVGQAGRVLSLSGMDCNQQFFCSCCCACFWTCCFPMGWTVGQLGREWKLKCDAENKQCFRSCYWLCFWTSFLTCTLTLSFRVQWWFIKTKSPQEEVFGKLPT